MRISADGDDRATAALEELEEAPSAPPRPLTRAERIRAMRLLLEAEVRPATPARSAPRPAKATAEKRPRSTGARRVEAREVLDELDQIAQIFAADSDATAPEPSDAVLETDAVCDPRGPQGRALWGQPSPYLEERMGGARSAAADLGRALEEIAARSDDLRGTVATLEDQLHRAAREIQFLRREEPTTTPLPLPARPLVRPRETATRVRTPATLPTLAPQAVVAPATATVAPFAEYTTEKYNRSVGVLANQRTKIGTTMLLLAAAISAVLLVITFLSHEPTPAAFVAGLPVIWMIPVPFFVVSFRGTQRVLRTNPMTLEGEF
jgi:hypothetical protein